MTDTSAVILAITVAFWAGVGLGAGLTYWCVKSALKELRNQ